MLNNNQIMILNVLQIAGRPLTAKEIGRRTGINDRTLREKVQDMRLKGFPVVSGNYGYKMAEHKSEMIKAINRIKSQIKDMNTTVNAMYGSMNKLRDDFENEN